MCLLTIIYLLSLRLLTILSLSDFETASLGIVKIFYSTWIGRNNVERLLIKLLIFKVGLYTSLKALQKH